MKTGDDLTIEIKKVGSCFIDELTRNSFIRNYTQVLVYHAKVLEMLHLKFSYLPMCSSFNLEPG